MAYIIYWRKVCNKRGLEGSNKLVAYKSPTLVKILTIFVEILTVCRDVSS